MCRACRMVMSEGTMHHHASPRILTPSHKGKEIRREKIRIVHPLRLFFASNVFVSLFLISHFIHIYMSTAGFCIWEEARGLSGTKPKFFGTFLFLIFIFLYPVSVSPTYSLDASLGIAQRYENRTNIKKKQQSVLSAEKKKWLL